MDVRYLTVGPVQENTWFASQDGRGLLIDPGDEPDLLKQAVADLGVTIEAILITHCHFDHVGAVAELARATKAPVHCPAGEVMMLENINDYVRFPGFGPFESYSPEVTVAGGDRLELAGFDIEVLSTPGHSPDHVTYVIGTMAFSGDVLFQGSIGRTDLPGSDPAILMQSIAMLLDKLPDDTNILPGHMGPTTLGAERATNPFLRELAAR